MLRVNGATRAAAWPQGLALLSRARWRRSIYRLPPRAPHPSPQGVSKSASSRGRKRRRAGGGGGGSRGRGGCGGGGEDGGQEDSEGEDGGAERVPDMPLEVDVPARCRLRQVGSTAQTAARYMHAR